MRMSIALPIAAALVAAIGISSPTPAHAKQKSAAACKADNIACTRRCDMFSGVMKQGCYNRCYLSQVSCETGRPVGTGSYKGTATGVKPGGGAWSSSTAGGQPLPKGPVLGKPAGTNGGGLQVVKPAGTNGGGLQVVKPFGRR